MTADARWGNGLLNRESAVVQLSEQVRLCKASHALNELWRPVVGPIAGETHRRLKAKAVKESRFSPRWGEGGAGRSPAEEELCGGRSSAQRVWQ